MAKGGTGKNTGGTNEQQKLFAYAYFNNKGNGTQAAIEAGYSPRSATSTASLLLTYPNIQALLASLHDQLQEKVVATKERIAEELAKIGFGDVRALFDENSILKPVHEWPDDAAAAVASVEVDQLWGATMDGKEQIGETKKVKRESKLQALKQLTELYGYNAPTKTAQTDVAGNDITPTKEEAAKIAANLAAGL